MSARVDAAAPNLAAPGTMAAFATPISTHVWPDSDAVNAALSTEILRRAETESGMDRSNIGGWHSTVDLLSWPGEAFQTLAARINRYVIDVLRTTMTGDGPTQMTLKTEAWANVSRRGNYNGVHDHPGAHWSGVYYVTAGTPDPGTSAKNGRLELLDPRPAINMLPLQGSVFEQRYLIDPSPGLMIVFPGWLKHFVHPYTGDAPRISIAFNVTIRAGADDDAGGGHGTASDAGAGRSSA
ncbi:MAG: TIGR02466 family protein [Pseudomonadota bacterium]